MSEPVVASGSPKSLPLILARELASNLATPMFLLDARGLLVYFNEAAARLIGKEFTDLGEIPADQFGEALQLALPDGQSLGLPRIPRGHRVLPAAPGAPIARGDVVRRRAPPVRGDCLPPLRSGRRNARRLRRLLAGLTRGTRELMQARVWGCRGSIAAPGADTVKYGGNTSCVEVRLASGHASSSTQGPVSDRSEF